MRYLSSTCLILVLLLSFGCKENAVKETMLEAANDPAAVKAEIEKKNLIIETNLAKGEIDSAAVHFADNVIQMPPNMPVIRGIEAYKEWWKQNVEFGDWKFDLQTQEVRTSGNLAVELGSYKLDFVPNETSPIPAMSDQGNYVVLWENIEGDWKIVWDAPVSDQPLFPPDSAQNEM